MGSQLGGYLVLGAVALPFVTEIVLQVWLEAKLFKSLSPDVRALFPPHPSSPWLIFAGSARFHWSLWRYLKQTFPGEPPDVVRIKAHLYGSVRRAMGWLALTAVAAAVLWFGSGWRPV